MSDLISRQAAIKILHEALDAVDQIADVPFGVYQNYRDKMNELPPAQPERIKGHWVNGRCDKCNEHAPFWCMASTYYASNLCPNCGADMREVTT